MNTIQEEAWLLREKYNGEHTSEYVVDLERLRRGEPLAYVIGFVPFLDTRIYLDSYPLIPRPETEFWVEKAISSLKDTPMPQVLDLCAGSGCIGVALAHALPAVRVDFAEIETRHHTTIERNVMQNGIEKSRTHIFDGDLFGSIIPNQQYSAILTNPPYIDPNIDRTEESVRSHEPHLALYGGEHGFEIIERIIKSAPNYLKSDGTLFIEHEPEQEAMIARLATLSDYRSCVAHKDQFEVVRYSVLVF
jgi:HemK-like putative methylase